MITHLSDAGKHMHLHPLVGPHPSDPALSSCFGLPPPFLHLSCPPLYHYSTTHLSLFSFLSQAHSLFSSFLSFSVGHSQQLEQLHHPVKTSYEGWGTACCVPCVLRGRLPPRVVYFWRQLWRWRSGPLPCHAHGISPTSFACIYDTSHFCFCCRAFELLRNSDVRQCLVGQTSTGKKKKRCVTRLMWVTGKNISKCDKANVSMQMSLICCPYRPFQRKKKTEQYMNVPKLLQ